jgi:hypothetical protein
VGALSNDQVGNYWNGAFVATFQKVGTFRRVGNQKQGGNVASYFCTPDGRVLHVVIGPVNASVLLKEARWVVETWKLAQLEARDDPAQMRFSFRKAHALRFREKQARPINLQSLAGIQDPQSRVHMLLTLSPWMKMEQVYQLVFEHIVGERVSTSPVIEVGKRACQS